MEVQMCNINSLEYFNSEICKFWQLCGQKSFWCDPNKVNTAKKAISHLYLNIELNNEDMQTAATTFQSAMVNFTHRALLMGFPI